MRTRGDFLRGESLLLRFGFVRREVVNREGGVRGEVSHPYGCPESRGDDPLSQVCRHRGFAFAQLAVAEGAHILRRHSTQRKARPRPEMREEVLYRLFISLPGFLPPGGFLCRRPFAKPALNREIVERFVARPLQDFIEQLAGLRGGECASERRPFRLFELQAKLDCLATVGLFGGFLEPPPVAGAIRKKSMGNAGA